MRRHSTDIVSLVFGLIFLAAAGWWLVARQLHLALNVPNGGWFIAGGLIVLGVIGVAASLRRGDDPRPATPAPVAPTVTAAAEPEDTTTTHEPYDEDDRRDQPPL